MKVLVVEDNRNDRMLLTKLLTSSNYEVAEVSNGIEALESAIASRPDMIISDIMMPEMDGFTLLREMKKNDKINDIPFIFYTANYVSEKDKQLATSLGASRFIVKPIEPKELLNQIETIFKDYNIGQVTQEKPLIKTEEEYLKQYSDRIFQKLEEKYVELNDIKDFLDAVLEDMGDGVIVSDPDLNVTYCNKRMHEIMQCSLSSGKMNPGEHHKPCIPDMRYATHELFETEVVNKEETVKYLEGIISPTINEGGELTTHIGVFRDVTERNRTREEIDKKKREIALLYDIDRLFSDCINSEELINCALDKVIEVLQVEGGCVYVIDEEHESAVVRQCKGMPPKFVELLKQQHLDREDIQAVLTSDKGVFMSLPSDRIHGLTEIQHGYGGEQIITVHLRSKGKIIGFADLMVSPYREISEENIEILESIGSLCGFALDNLLVHEKLDKLKQNN